MGYFLPSGSHKMIEKATNGSHSDVRRHLIFISALTGTRSQADVVFYQYFVPNGTRVNVHGPFYLYFVPNGTT
jgi:hypothetical protein